MSGEATVITTTTRLVSVDMGMPQTGTPLTDREVEALRMIAGGVKVEAVGRALGMNPGAALSMLSRTYRKMGVRNSTQAVYRAVSRGIIEPEVGS